MVDENANGDSSEFEDVDSDEESMVIKPNKKDKKSKKSK